MSQTENNDSRGERDEAGADDLFTVDNNNHLFLQTPLVTKS